MLDLYLNEIKKGIKKHDLVKDNSILKGKKWTKSSYDQLSKILSSYLSTNLPAKSQISLGTTISSKTLSNIYKGLYKLSYPIDPRTLNTLTKLVVFLGYDNWELFVKTVDSKQNEKLKNANPSEAIKLIVQKAIESEFKIYNSLPTYDEHLLTPYFIENSSAYKKILDVLNQKKTDRWVLSNPYNPSTFALLAPIEILDITDDIARVKTKEYWLLCWRSLATDKYIKRYKNISDHYYILNKVDGVWKINTNASLADFNEMETSFVAEVA